MNTIGRDLARKLHDDVQRAIMRYIELGEMVDESPSKQVSIVLGELTYIVIEIAQRSGLSKDQFFACTGRAWDQNAKEGKQ